MNITFFTSSSEFRTWLEEHHETTQEVWGGFYKKSSGKPSITWPEAVDEALCFGWIDGQRQGIKFTHLAYNPPIRYTATRANVSLLFTLEQARPIITALLIDTKNKCYRTHYLEGGIKRAEAQAETTFIGGCTLFRRLSS